MQSRKRRRAAPPSIHPRNRYSSNPPDFALLASLYPSFHPFVFTSRSGRPNIDWTDFNATRELTRVLLFHDHSVNWWIPDGQLCPTVPNRSNYIHWIEDLLSSELVPASRDPGGRVRGFDIGTGANCIYPLLGASLLGWSFVGSDVTDVALEWARKNVESNPHLTELIEIRNANTLSSTKDNMPKLEKAAERPADVEKVESLITEEAAEPPSDLEKVESSTKEEAVEWPADVEKVEPSYPNLKDVGHEPPVLVGVVRDGENFDFCMCNPPFFESIEEAGLNPKTSCGGTLAEMVYPGGERAFITRIIEDSVVLKHSFRWFTSMVGRKTNLKFLMSKLREVGVSIVKTTEFVQGQTARWGLAWSFVSPNKKLIAINTPRKNNHSFTLEGLQRQFGAFQVLKSVESFFIASGASCKTDLTSFCVNITLSSEQTDRILTEESVDFDGRAICSISSGSDNPRRPSEELSFRVSVFEQIPGTVLVRGSLLHKESPLSGLFSSFLGQLEGDLKKEFLSKPHRNFTT